MGKKRVLSGNKITALRPYKDKKPYTRSGLYRDYDVNLVDGRTRLGKSIALMRAELWEYAGKQTALKRMLIERIIPKRIKLLAYEAETLKNPQVKESDHYIPLSNSLRLDLVALQQMVEKEGRDGPIPSLIDYIEATYAENRRDKPDGSGKTE